jgi:ribosomal protein S18 acetylase RimI-like enzyme
MLASDFSRIHLRPVSPEDRPFLLAVYSSSRAEEMAMVPWTPEQKAEFLRSQFEAQDFHYRKYYDGAEYLVIELDAEPIGRLYLHRTPAEIRIMDIALLPEHRNQGIGGKLVRDVMNEAAAIGLKVSLHVESYNPAQRLYRRLGFVEAGESGVYQLLEWTPSGESEPE